MSLLIDLCERGLIPDALTRGRIRRLCALRLREEHAHDPAAADARYRALLEALRASPIAVETEAANAQHYEVPTRFFALCLGRRLKYSCCYYPTGRETLDEAEEAMLALYGERAQLADGQRILELGCGWGSLTLWMAERYPQARIVGVSNSRTQREHILAQAAERGLANVEILTCDINRLALDRRFDRVVSIEMFEHMRNYAALLERIAGWLAGGALPFRQAPGSRRGRGTSPAWQNPNHAGARHGSLTPAARPATENRAMVLLRHPVEHDVMPQHIGRAGLRRLQTRGGRLLSAGHRPDEG